MKPLSAVAVAAGNTSSLVGGTLTYQGLGDWQNVIDVQFPPGAFQANDRISVVVSAVLANPNPGSLGPAPVCVATEVSPVGFVLRARNSSSEGGVASFNWMATAEQAGRVEPVNVRMGRTPPLRYLRNEPPGPGFGVNWQTQLVLFANPLEKTPLVLVTGSDPFGSLAAATWQQLGDTETGVTSPHLAACVGTVLKAEPGGIEIASHNTDCVAGFCGSNYVALSQDPLDTPDLWINAGVVSDGYPFSRQCTDGDWHLIPISFPIPFASPPVVLVTAAGDPGNEPAGEASTPAVVGLATYVTTDYFVLAARNSDSAGGMANFNHIAIGCGVGCGQGPIVESL